MGKPRSLLPLVWFALVLATACSDDTTTATPTNPETAPVTIRFLRHDNPNYRDADNAFFAEYKAAHPNVAIADATVNFSTLAANLNGDLKQDRLEYDLLLIPPGWVCGYADNLTDVPAEVVSLTEAQNTFFPAPLAGSTCGGKLKGLPVEYNLEYGGVVVNLDKYQARFPGKTPAWPNWNAFIAEAAALTEYDSGMPMANGLDIAPDWPPPVISLLLSQILQRGGNYWAPGGGLLKLDTPEAQASLTAMVGWLNNDRVMHRGLIPDKNSDVTTRLAAGATGYGWSDPAKPLAVMGYVGTWGVPSTVRQVQPPERWHFDFFALPPIVGTEHKFVSDSGWAFAVPRTSRNPRVAWDIARSLALSPESMRKWSAVTGALPALRANGSPTAAASNPTVAKVQHLLEKGQWIGYIPSDAIVSVAFGLVNNFFGAAAGQKTVEQALADMQRTANEAITQAQGN